MITYEYDSYDIHSYDITLRYNEFQTMLIMSPSESLYQQKLRLLGRDRRKLQFPLDYDKDSTSLCL